MAPLIIEWNSVRSGGLKSIQNSILPLIRFSWRVKAPSADPNARRLWIANVFNKMPPSYRARAVARDKRHDFRVEIRHSTVSQRARGISDSSVRRVYNWVECLWTLLPTLNTCHIKFWRSRVFYSAECPRQSLVDSCSRHRYVELSGDSQKLNARTV